MRVRVTHVILNLLAGDNVRDVLRRCLVAFLTFHVGLQ
jgi:hypothetical protein